MRTLATLAPLFIAGFMNGQGDPAVRLWAEARRTGHVQQSFDQPGPVNDLRIDLQGQVSSLEIARGFTVTFFDREDNLSTHSFTFTGPCTVDDLKWQPMNGLKGNWDGSVASLFIERDANRQVIPPVLAAVHVP